MESKRFSAWADLLAMVCILFAATLVAMAFVTAAKVAFPALELGQLSLIAYVAQFSLAVIGGMIWLQRRGGSRLRLGVSWSDAPMILGGIVLVTVTGIVLEPLLNLIPEHYLEKLNEMIGRGGWAILMTVVAAPVLEEFFFRGLILETLSRRWSSRMAVLTSAALFGLVHLPVLPQMVNAFVVAVIMGYIYLATRSLIPVIAIHAINNGLAYMTLELTGTQSTDTRALIANDTIYWVVYAASVVVLAVSLILMDRAVRTKNSETALNTKTADE